MVLRELSIEFMIAGDAGVSNNRQIKRKILEFKNSNSKTFFILVTKMY